MLVTIFDNRSKTKVDEGMLEEIESFMTRTLLHEEIGVECEISYSFVDGEEIKALNAEYRGKDQVTDVLSFPMHENFLDNKEAIIKIAGEHPILLGDVIINTDQAKAQGDEFGHGFAREICYLSVHSVLHLLGYDHLEDEDKREMREVEKDIMGD
ncbi:MAG: putative rRNA maturation factor [Eubacteriaceae bacterium]|jgi:probable rRNA maturation factor|nr:putative rRNA maturation factor [Eubacteriaceae bacterium]